MLVVFITTLLSRLFGQHYNIFVILVIQKSLFLLVLHNLINVTS